MMNKVKTPGKYEMEIELSDIPDVVYFCAVNANEEKRTNKKMKSD